MDFPQYTISFINFLKLFVFDPKQKQIQAINVLKQNGGIGAEGIQLSRESRGGAKAVTYHF